MGRPENEALCESLLQHVQGHSTILLKLLCREIKGSGMTELPNITKKDILQTLALSLFSEIAKFC
jgi:hypothetical protein